MGDSKIYEASTGFLTKTAIFALECPEKISSYMNDRLDRILGPVWDFAAGYDRLPENRVPYSKKIGKHDLEDISMN